MVPCGAPDGVVVADSVAVIVEKLAILLRTGVYFRINVVAVFCIFDMTRWLCA